MSLRKAEHRQSLRNGSLHPIRQLRSDIGILDHDLLQISFCLIPIRGIEDRPDIRRYLSPHPFSGHILAGILLQMELAALPGNPGEECLAGLAQPVVVIADDQADTLQTTIEQSFQEQPPVLLCFTH